MSPPRLVIAAPASGSGKTTVATGLMAALANRGLSVSPHKVGPDYIDPGYHALATGRPGRNLDAWLVGEDLIGPLFRHGSQGADIAVVEGVMGLYDGAAERRRAGGAGGQGAGGAGGQGAGGARGRDDAAGHGVPGDFASTAHVAKLLSAPVVLVVDAASAGRSVAAVVQGFVSYDPSVRIGGVVLNRVGSDRHEEICRAAVEETGLPVLGALRRRADIVTPSRHLGLVPAAERRAEAVHTVQRLGELIAESCDLAGLVRLARTALPLTAARWDPRNPPNPTAARPPRPIRPAVAVAGGAAFTFGYAENAELLAGAGAEILRFDPLNDEALPTGSRGLVIGGGFPEMYAAELSANEPLRAEVARLARSGAPVYAECAGLLYLARQLDGRPMCGVLDATASMTDRLTLGYRAAVAVSDSALTKAGERVRGHEFHRTAVTPGHGTAPAWQWSADGPEGFAAEKSIASYLHLHWAGVPNLPRRFVEACA